MNIEKMEQYVNHIVGSPFIKERKITEDYIEVSYFNSYSEFKATKSQSNISEEMFNDYFETGDKIPKILIGEPVRLLRQFPFLQRVGFELRGYNFIVNREDLNNLLGFRVEELSVEDGTWVTEFANEYIYNKKNRDFLFQQIEKFSNELFNIENTNNLSINAKLSWLNKEIEENRIIIKDGSLEYTQNQTSTESEKKYSKFIWFILKLIVAPLGNSVLNDILDNEIVNSFKDIYDDIFK